MSAHRQVDASEIGKRYAGVAPGFLFAFFCIMAGCYVLILPMCGLFLCCLCVKLCRLFGGSQDCAPARAGTGGVLLYDRSVTLFFVFGVQFYRRRLCTVVVICDKGSVDV